jgi:hypothetical protein
VVGRIGHWLLGFGLALGACSGRTGTNSAQGSAGASASAGKASTGATAGSDAGGAAQTGGAASAGTKSGGSSNGGTTGEAEGGEAEVAGTAGGGTTGGGTAGGGAAGTGGSSPLPDPNEILKVKPSAGCGKDATQDTGIFVKYTMQTSGTKDANCADKLNGVPKCGDWSVPRDYYVWLPPNYDKTKAYPLVFQAPGCGGIGTNVYSLSPSNTDVGVGVNGTVIRVGLTPPPNSIGHGTNENQGCFDDKEGDDSVDFVFYENLIDKLKTELCYDENRVFANGNSSGAWLANELGCKYAGDTKGYAIRGVVVNTGGLPSQIEFSPTCTTKPMAGFWVGEINDVADSFAADRFAIARAMKVNQCTIGTSLDSATLENFPIGGGNPDTTCKRVLGCPEQYPLVACRLPGNQHGGHEDVINPGFAAFLQVLASP